MHDKYDYKYKSDRDLLDALFESFDGYLKPFFQSYDENKKTFYLQTVNFALAFILIKFILSGLFNFLLINIEGSSTLGMEIFLTIVIVILFSFAKKNKVLKWQTLYHMEYPLAKKWLVRFIGLHLIMHLYREIKSIYHEKTTS